VSVVCLVVSTLAGCGSVTESFDGRDPFEALEDCPRDDLVWLTALQHARRNDAFGDLLELAERIAGANPARWQPRWAAAESLRRIDRPAEAEAAYRRVLELARAAGEPIGIARGAHRTGVSAYRAGDLDAAETLLRESLDAARASRRDDLEATSLNALAGIRRERGDLGGAQRLLERAIRALVAARLPDQARRVAINRAVILIRLGNAAEARSLLERLYEESLADQDAYTLPRVALTLGNLERRTRHPDRAREWYARVPESARDAAALARLGQGLIATVERRLEDARAHFDEAGRMASTEMERLLVRAYRAEADGLAGDHEAAAGALGEVIREADRGGHHDPRWIARWLAGRNALAEGDSSDATRWLRETVVLLESQGGALDPLQEGLRFLRERAGPFADLAVALTEENAPDGPDDRSLAEILLTIERTHARALRRALGSRGERIAGADLARLRAGFPDDALLLDYLIGEDRGVVLALRGSRVRVVPTVGWSVLADPLRRYRAALVRPLRSAEARLDPAADLRPSLPLGRDVRRMILGGVEDLLDGARRLYVVPDGALALLPFAALPEPGPGPAEPPRFLGQRVDTAVLPLAGAPPAWGRVRTPVLLAGDPLADPSGAYPRLGRAGEELERIRAIWGDTTRVLSAERFTLETFGALATADFRTLHLATHAEASTSDPSRCAVLLSRGERLGVDAVADLSLDSAVVLLSACRTGEGELVPGEGVVGLSWAFLGAGARGVAASLWTVDDDAATELMVAFHRHLREGDDPVGALARARRELSRTHPHPAWWAPFVMVVRPHTDPAPARNPL
jgi:tetratricopeptide (TPR) repeat protein